MSTIDPSAIPISTWVNGRSLTPPEGWILVLGGLTDEGQRRAHRAAARAASSGAPVIWFSPRLPAPQADHPSTDHRDDAPAFSLVAYGMDGSKRWGRLVERLSTSSAGGAAMRGGAARSWRRLAAAVALPLASWYAMKGLLVRLEHRPPRIIIYTEEHSLTAAWHAARMWPDSVFLVRGPVDP